jgi:glycolate oxidase FAD binding subunit
VSVATRTLGGALAAIVGADAATDAPMALAAAAIDGREPRWVVRPRALEDVARVVALAHDEGLVVAARGCGTALTLGHPPARVDVVLDLGALDAVLEHNPEDMTATVQAGVLGGALAARLVAHRQTLPLDPPGWSSRSLGGIASTGASGPLRLRYGTMRDLLLGVRFVQADGVLTWGGARVVKSVTGYDVPKLLVGSLGTLGVLGELTLRLHPLPEVETTCLLAVASVDAAVELAASIVDSTLQPSRVELLDAAALTVTGLPPAAAGLVVSFGSVEAAVRAQQAEVTATAARSGARIETLGPAFWRTYDRALAGRGATQLRVSTLATRLVAIVAEVRDALAGAEGLVLTGCPPLGILRVTVGPGDVRALAAAVERVRGFVAAEGGGVVIERAGPALRALVDPWGPVDAPALALMCGLKQEFDPRRILNAGRFVGGI